VLTQLDLFKSFDADIGVPNVDTYEELFRILKESDAFSDAGRQRVIGEMQERQERTRSREVGVGIKKILFGIEMARQDEDIPGRFAEFMARAVAERGSA
jgi:vesicle-fusing ATPase